MSETFKIRDFIVDFLRKELVGPSPGYPAVQINGEEILRPQDPPRQRYGAGILFPMRFQTLKQDETTEGEDDSGDADSPEPDAIVEHPGTDVGEDSEVGPPENPPETDQEVTLANEFLPSAMGISALVEVPRQLHIDVSAGIYAHEEFQWETRRDKDGKEFYPKAWWRRPVVALCRSQLASCWAKVRSSLSSLFWRKTGKLFWQFTLLVGLSKARRGHRKLD